MDVWQYVVDEKISEKKLLADFKSEDGMESLWFTQAKRLHEDNLRLRKSLIEAEKNIIELTPEEDRECFNSNCC